MSRYRTGVSSSYGDDAARLDARAEGARRARPALRAELRAALAGLRLRLARAHHRPRRVEPHLRSRAGRQPRSTRGSTRATDGRDAGSSRTSAAATARWSTARTSARSSSSRTTRSASATRSSSSSRPAPRSASPTASTAASPASARRRLFTELVGGAQIDHIAADIERIAPTELSAVILGETGTGKEVVARGIHRFSGRRGSLQAINCAAIPHNLLESELFGYRRGAFSGADRDKPGLIKLADNGTLFLDEIGDMPLDAQAKLLRVLQSREVFPLGATTPERVDVRVVCATHRDLYQYVKEGKFRGDLLARLERARRPPAAAARAQGGHLPPRAQLRRALRPPEPAVHVLVHRRAPPLRLAVQRARARELHQARRRAHRRRRSSTPCTCPTRSAST